MNRPVIAIMYDFDKTLCTKNMQEFTFVPNVNKSPDEFWKHVAKLASEKKMDSILAYMYMMLETSREAKMPIHRENFVELGKDIEYYPGVETWFGRINAIGEKLGIEIEHYIVSSGVREIIEGTSIYKSFKEVFACEFLYNENNVACWPKNAINYTTKTQILFRINKGVLDISEDDEVNRYTPAESRRVPFRNMIYIGDGLTDVPCMKLVKVNGGYSIAVFAEGEPEGVKSLIDEGRVDFIEAADYSEGSELESTVGIILNKMAAENRLVQRNKMQMEG